MKYTQPREISHLTNDYQEVTPHDTNELPKGWCRGIWPEASGVIAVKNGEGDTVTFTVTAGMWNEVPTNRILVSGTDAEIISAGVRVMY